MELLNLLLQAVRLSEQDALTRQFPSSLTPKDLKAVWIAGTLHTPQQQIQPHINGLLLLQVQVLFATLTAELIWQNTKVLVRLLVVPRQWFLL